MKKEHLFYSVAAAVLLTAGLSSCSGDDEAAVTPVVENNYTVKLTATLGTKGGDATRALSDDGKTTTWEVDEEIAIYYQKTDDSYATVTATVTAVDETTKTATIEATLTNPQEGTVSLVYPASLADDEGGINKSRLLNGQNGTLAGISTSWDAATGSATMTVSGGKASLPDDMALENQLCIVKYTLRDSEDNSIEAKPLKINDGTNEYTITPSEAASELYVAMLPVSSASITFMATVGSETYMKTYSGITLAQGKFYSNSKVKLAKVTTLAALKEIVANSASLSDEFKAAYMYRQVDVSGIVAETVPNLIGYVGYMSPTDVDTCVVGTQNILVLAKEDVATNIAWGPRGEYADINDGALRSTSAMNGYYNTRFLQEKYPAYAAAEAWKYDGTIPEGGSDHWFLPSYAQLSSIMTYNPETAEKKMGTNRNLYWSSTEYNQNYAWNWTYSRGMSYNNNFKSNASSTNVRPVFAY